VSFTKITRASEVTLHDVQRAALSRDGADALLNRLTVIARPGDGALTVLLLLAQIVGRSWLEGDLCVELSADEGGTTIDVLTDANGVRKRVYRPRRFVIPIDELIETVERMALHLEPLVMIASAADRAVLVSARSLRPPTPARKATDDVTPRNQTLRPLTPFSPSVRPWPTAVGAAEKPRTSRIQTKSFETSGVRREVERLENGGDATAHAKDDVDGEWD
jgi:hypothetical protein